MSNSIKLNVPFGKLRAIMDWCEGNCAENWKVRNIATDDGYHQQELGGVLDIVYAPYTFEFENEQDLLLFALRWK